MDRFNLASLFRLGREQKNRRKGERRTNRRTTPNIDTTVLVVDDSKTVRFALSRMLQQGHFKVLHAEDGEIGIEKAITHQPQLIIMDIMMPGINGFRATRHLRKQERTKDIPIIMISGNEEVIDQFWSAKVGADGFLPKPFTRGGLYKVIESVLYRNETAA
jgi:CheY-like chemotaxis protein